MLNDLHRDVSPLDREISDMHLLILMMMVMDWIDGMILSRRGVLDDRVNDYVEAVVQEGRGVEGAMEVYAAKELIVP